MFDIFPQKMIFSVLCFDLDGTLIDHTGKSNEVVKCLNKKISEYKKRGAKIVYASARNKRDTVNAINKHVLCKPNYLITDLGLHLYEFGEKCKELKMTARLKYNWDKGKIDKLINSTKGVVSRKRSRSGPLKLTYYTYGEQHTIKCINRKLRLKNLDVSVFCSGNNSIYLIPKGYSKGKSLELLIRNLNIDKRDICVFGDSEADFSMYSKIRNSVLVGNADPFVKKYVIKKYPNIYISNKKYTEGVLDGLLFFEKEAYKIFNKNLNRYHNLYKNSDFNQIKKEIMVDVENRDIKVKILNLLTLGDVCEKQGSFRNARRYFLKADKLIDKLCDFDLQSLIKIQVARNYVSLGELDKGVKLLKEIKIQNENVDLKKYAMNSLAYAYRVQGKNKEAEKILNGLNDSRLKTGIDLSIAHNLAGLYRDLEQYEESLNLYKKILNKTDQTNIFAIAKLYNNIGFIYRKMGKYSLAEKYYLKSYQMEKKIGSKQLQGRTLNNLGGICRMRKRYKEALSYFSDSAHIRSSIGDNLGLSSSLLNKGVVLREMGERRAAKKFLKKSYNFRKRTGSVKLINEIKIELEKL